MHQNHHSATLVVLEGTVQRKVQTASHLASIALLVPIQEIQALHRMKLAQNVLVERMDKKQVHQIHHSVPIVVLEGTVQNLVPVFLRRAFHVQKELPVTLLVHRTIQLVMLATPVVLIRTQVRLVVRRVGLDSTILSLMEQRMRAGNVQVVTTV